MQLLKPFSALYGLGARYRNHQYDSGRLKSFAFDLPVIGVGNLSVGGTGKTPVTEYLLRLLIAAGYRPGVVSRGYGRRTKGYMLAEPNVTARDIGDEPYQMHRKFGDRIAVGVCEKRLIGISALLADKPETDVIVLDDSFQHRAVKPGLSVLLTDYARPYYDDDLLPAGRLREPASGRQRADIIIMTKCPPDLSPDDRRRLTEKLAPEDRQRVFFTSIDYDDARNADTEEVVELTARQSAVLFTGIARPEPLEDYLHTQIGQLTHLRFNDHHRFSAKDTDRIRAAYEQLPGNDKLLITTEKDRRRMEDEPAAVALNGLPMVYIPVRPVFHDDASSFDQIILNYARANQRSDRLSSGAD